MTNMTDIGPRTVAQAYAASSLSYIPPADREFRSTRLLVVNPSANDTWVISVGGKEIMRFLQLVVGNQQLLGGIYGNFPRNRDFWTWHYRVFGEYLTIPVPRGQAISIASVGGATANLAIMGIDLTIGSVSPAEVNHYQGTRWRFPVFGYVSAAVAAATEVLFDTEVKPSWIKNLLVGNPFAPGWRATISALFLEAAGVNTYSGAANHQSVTDHIAILKNGDRMFSHVQSGATSGPFATVVAIPAGQVVAPGGIPVFAQPSAAGSANTVYGQGSNLYPAFQTITEETMALMDPGISINPGDTVGLYYGITGDVTGGADYSKSVAVALVDAIQTG